MSITSTVSSASPVNTFLSSLTSSLLSECKPDCVLTLQPAYATWKTNSSIPALATTYLVVNPTSNQTTTSIDCNTQVLTDYYLNRLGGAQRIQGVDENCRLIGNFPNIEQLAGVNSYYTSDATVTYPATYLDAGIRFGAEGIFSTIYSNGSSKCLTYRNSYLTGPGTIYSGELSETTVTYTSVVAVSVTGVSTGTYTRTYRLMPQLSSYYPAEDVIRQCGTKVSFETSPNTLTAANYLTSVRTLPGAAPVAPSPQPGNPQQPPPAAPQQPEQPAPTPPAGAPAPGNSPQPPPAAPATTVAGPAPAPTPQNPGNGNPSQPQQPGQQPGGIGGLISAIIGVGQGQNAGQSQPTQPAAPGSGSNPVVVVPGQSGNNPANPDNGNSPASLANPNTSPQQNGQQPAPNQASVPTTIPALVVNGQTALPGGSAIVANGQTVSVVAGGNAVVVGTSTVPIAEVGTAFTNVPGLTIAPTSVVADVPAQLRGAGGAPAQPSDVANYIISGLGGGSGGSVTLAPGSGGAVVNGTGTGSRPAQFTGAAERAGLRWWLAGGVSVLMGLVLAV
ncbi:hypothetical protein BDZ85DRAFT_258452 [Elsinoe ampelina]|uniref:Uncharacterized protein n=1 Tax=Elsinoe ampelina TaxID=302913 RepID=A0A6A6GJS3_9PEZI|nr:hypothetical protein BDZ85DRAFT_258452 [Elsinoe ampelina]